MRDPRPVRALGRPRLLQAADPQAEVQAVPGREQGMHQGGAGHRSGTEAEFARDRRFPVGLLRVQRKPPDQPVI